MCLNVIVGIFSMVSLCSYGICLIYGMSFVARCLLFPAHLSEISGLATTQCYYIQDEAGPLFFFTIGAFCYSQYCRLRRLFVLIYLIFMMLE